MAELPLIDKEETINLLFEFFKGKYTKKELENMLKYGWELNRDAFNKYKSEHPSYWTDFYRDSETLIFDGLQWYFGTEVADSRYKFDSYILEVTKKAKGKRVLDFGAGVGLTTIYLTLNGFNVTFVEYSLQSQLSKFAMFLAEKFKVKDEIEWREWSDVEGKFNCIVSIDALGYIPEWRSIFDKFLKLLAPSGTVYITAPFASANDNWRSENLPMQLKSGVSLKQYLKLKGYEQIDKPHLKALIFHPFPNNIIIGGIRKCL